MIPAYCTRTSVEVLPVHLCKEFGDHCERVASFGHVRHIPRPGLGPRNSPPRRTRRSHSPVYCVSRGFGQYGFPVVVVRGCVAVPNYKRRLKNSHETRLISSRVRGITDRSGVYLFRRRLTTPEPLCPVAGLPRRDCVFCLRRPTSGETFDDPFCFEYGNDTTHSMRSVKEIQSPVSDARS